VVVVVRHLGQSQGASGTTDELVQAQASLGIILLILILSNGRIRGKEEASEGEIEIGLESGPGQT